MSRISDKTYKALVIIIQQPIGTARQLAEWLWGDDTEKRRTLFQKISNQGNGACHGKAAWLSAGSYAGRLQKMGYVRKYPPGQRDRYVVITKEGIQAVSDYESGIK